MYYTWIAPLPIPLEKRESASFSLSYILGCFWMILSSTFARKPDKIYYDDRLSVGFVILFTFFAGNLVFMSYRASLTSELSIKKETKPFEDLESFLDTDYE